MKHIINDQVVLSRAPEGPLAANIGAFAKSLSAQGYAPGSIHRHLTQPNRVGGNSRPMMSNGIEFLDLTGLRTSARDVANPATGSSCGRRPGTESAGSKW